MKTVDLLEHNCVVYLPTLYLSTLICNLKSDCAQTGENTTRLHHGQADQQVTGEVKAYGLGQCEIQQFKKKA